MTPRTLQVRVCSGRLRVMKYCSSLTVPYLQVKTRLKFKKVYNVFERYFAPLSSLLFYSPLEKSWPVYTPSCHFCNIILIFSPLNRIFTQHCFLDLPGSSFIISNRSTFSNLLLLPTRTRRVNHIHFLSSKAAFTDCTGCSFLVSSYTYLINASES